LSRSSLDTPDQIPQFTSFNPTLTTCSTSTSTSDPPTLTNLPDDPTGLAANDTAHGHHHVCWNYGIRQDFAVIFDDTKGADDSVCANVDVRTYRYG
jgi:hypothetical protein